MGTRSITHFEESGNIILSLYRQYDGMPSGHGKDLYEIMNGREIVNGISGNRDSVYNGIGDLVVNVVACLKEKNGGIGNAGGLYIVGPRTSAMDEEYTYYVRIKNGVIHIEIREVENIILFNGPVSELIFVGII